jgi:hypothetical protein
VLILDPYDFFWAKCTHFATVQTVRDIYVDLHRYNAKAAEITRLTAHVRGVNDIAQSEGQPAAMLQLPLTNPRRDSTNALYKDLRKPSARKS